MINIESNKIVLRAPEPSDLEILYNWENNQNLWEVSQTIAPISKLILKEYIKKSQLDIFQTKQLRLMIDLKQDDDNLPIGAIDIFDFDPMNKRAGLGIMIDSNFRNKGIASEAIELTINYCFNTLQLHQLYCNILENNKTSLSVFKQKGFEIVGLKKDWIKSKTKWHNEYLLQKISKHS